MERCSDEACLSDTGNSVSETSLAVRIAKATFLFQQAEADPLAEVDPS